MTDMEPLFGRFSLLKILQYQEQEALKKIVDSLEDNRLLNTSLTNLIEYFVSELQITPLQIFPENIYVDQNEIKNTKKNKLLILDRQEPNNFEGTQINYHLPYQGDKNLLYALPTHSTISRPRAYVTDTELIFTFESIDHNGKAIKTAFEKQLRDLIQYLEWSKQEIDFFNSKLPQQVQQYVELRRQKLLDDLGTIASLGYPLRKRDDASTTFVVPVTRKRIVILPPSTMEPYNPEPTLEMAEYEQILSIISNMVLVMERSPSAFCTMKEEDFRQHFLVQLNGQYQGQATAETFNYQGKTDILIRVDGKNIFIAECKFWKGEKGLLETVTQLLGYTSWRDTKTAILIFNRNKNFSEVVEGIPEIIMKHPNFKRQLSTMQETSTKYLFHHIDDPNREIILTVMAFDVPRNK